MGGFFSPSTTIGGSVLAPGIPLTAAALSGLYQLPGFNGLGVAVNAQEYFQINNADLSVGYKPVAAFGVSVDAVPFTNGAGTDCVISPDGRFVYSLTNVGLQGYIVVSSRNLINGDLTEISGSPFTLQIGSRDTQPAISPDGKHLYLASSFDDLIDLYALNQTTGAPAFVASYVSPTNIPTYAPGCIQVTADGAFVLCADGNNIRVFSRNSNTGVLTEVAGSPFASGVLVYGIKVTSDNRFVYSANATAGTVSAFSMSATGALTPLAGSPYAVGVFPTGVSISPDDAFLYINNTNASTVSAFAISPVNGELTAIAGSPFGCTTNSRQTAISSDGTEFFIGGNGSISAYSRDTITGFLTPIVGSPFAVTAGSFYGISISPDDAFVYVALFGADDIYHAATVAAPTYNLINGVYDPVGGLGGAVYINGALYVGGVAVTPTGGGVAVPRLLVGDQGTEGSGVNIGGVVYESSFKVSEIAGTNYAQTILHRHSTTREPLIVGARSNTNDDTHANVTAGMNVFSVYGAGWAGTNYKLFGQLSFAADNTGTISNTSAPGKFTVLLTPDGTVTPVAALTIRNTGRAYLPAGVTLGTAGTVSATDAAIDAYGTTNAIFHGHNVGAQGTTAGAAIIGYALPAGAAMTATSRLGAFVLGGSQTVAGALGNSFALEAFATENWTAAANGTRAQISVTPNGSLVRAAAVTIGQDGAVGIKGAVDGGNAAAGFVGEYIESVVAVAAAIALVTTATTVITSINLSAGDWDVDGAVAFDFDATTNITLLRGNPGTAGIDTQAGYSYIYPGGVVPGSGATSHIAGSSRATRISTNAPITVNLYARADFTVAACRTFGTIRARRVR